MKKFMVRCDIEGVSGVVSYAQAEPGNPEYEFGRSMFLNDLSALLTGLNQGGADSIVIYEIDQGTGKLSYVGHEPTLGKTPRNFAIDPTGTFLLVANQDSGKNPLSARAT